MSSPRAQAAPPAAQGLTQDLKRLRTENEQLHAEAPGVRSVRRSGSVSAFVVYGV